MPSRGRRRDTFIAWERKRLNKRTKKGIVACGRGTATSLALAQIINVRPLQRIASILQPFTTTTPHARKFPLANALGKQQHDDETPGARQTVLRKSLRTAKISREQRRRTAAYVWCLGVPRPADWTTWSQRRNQARRSHLLFSSSKYWLHPKLRHLSPPACCGAEPIICHGRFNGAASGCPASCSRSIEMRKAGRGGWG